VNVWIYFTARGARGMSVEPFNSRPRIGFHSKENDKIGKQGELCGIVALLWVNWKKIFAGNGTRLATTG